MDGEYATEGDAGWEAIVQGETSGPYDLAALKLLVLHGRLGPDDAVRRPGTAAWRRASTIEGLFVAVRPPRGRRPPPPASEPVIRPPSDYAVEFPDALPAPVTVQGPISPWKREVLEWRARRSNTWILRHWRGELPLPASFWINGVPGDVVLFGLTLLTGGLFELRNMLLPLLGLAVFYTAFLIVVAWQSVGMWRSAKRARDQKKRHFWPGVAQIMVILLVLSTAATLAYRAVPQLGNGWRAAIGDPEFGPRGVRILREGTEIEISGAFARGTADTFAAALDSAPKARVVHLDSPGGRIGEALSVRDLIAQHGLDTYVERQCAAACTLAYLGGKRRWLGPDAVMGFYLDPLGGIDGHMAGATMAAAYAAAGLPASFIEKAISTPAARIWQPSAEELVAAGLVTDRAPRGRFGTGGYGPAPTAESIIANLDRTETLAALREADGARWTEIEQAAVRIALAGDPPGELAQLIHAHAVAAAGRLRSRVPDGTALAINQLMEREAEALQRKDPEICWRYFFKGAADPAADLPPDLATLDASATDRILIDGTDHPVSPPSAALGRKLVAEALEGGKARGIDPKRVAAALRPGKASHAAACQAFRDLLSLADALPAADHAALLRFLLSGAR